MIGWANVSVAGAELRTELGYVAGAPPPGRMYRRELDAEIQRMRRFLAP